MVELPAGDPLLVFPCEVFPLPQAPSVSPAARAAAAHVFVLLMLCLLALLSFCSSDWRGARG